MSDTPYDPPKARLADPEAPRPVRPTSVRRAAICLWISSALTLISPVLHLAIVTTSDVVLTTVTAALLALVAAKVADGRRWARWLYVALWVLGSFFGTVSFLLMPQVFLALPGTVQAVFVLQFALQTAALALLFTRASREWFSA